MVELLALVKTEVVRLESLHACKAWIAKAGAAVSTIKPLGIEMSLSPSFCGGV